MNFIPLFLRRGSFYGIKSHGFLLKTNSSVTFLYHVTSRLCSSESFKQSTVGSQIKDPLPFSQTRNEREHLSPVVEILSSDSEGPVGISDNSENSLILLECLPLTLVEEVSEIQDDQNCLEHLLASWSQVQEKYFKRLIFCMRLIIIFGIFLIFYGIYTVKLAAERKLRGVGNMPRGLKVGNAVYFDLSENGKYVGRLLIGLLTENCPLYCEDFHRRCTGSGGMRTPSFRGMELGSLIANTAVVFGDGQAMTHSIPGFNPHFLPTEWQMDGVWRGALSSISYGSNKESPNFAIHMIGGGRFTPQVFGIILGGYDILERISFAGNTHSVLPRNKYVIEDCGEMCMLPGHEAFPLPRKLYDEVSYGYDYAKFGKNEETSLLATI